MLQNQPDVMHQNMLRMFVVPAVLQFLTDLFQKAYNDLSLRFVGKQGLVGVVRKIGVLRHPSSEFGASDQFGVEQQSPAFGLDFLACVALATDLSGRDAHDGVLVQVVAQQAVSEVFQKLIGNENAVDVVVVEAVAAMLQLVVVDDADQRMQLRRTDVTRIVVDAVNFQHLLFHAAKIGKITFPKNDCFIRKPYNLFL